MTPSIPVSSSLPLAGKAAVVTGAAGGIGVAIARRLASLGARVALLDLQFAAAQDLAAGMRADGHQVLALACDVADEASVVTAALAVGSAFGGCDVLVNNAGILAPRASIATLQRSDWDRVFAVNVTGALLCTREFGRSMCERRGGSIVNIASIAASVPNSSPPYSASKAALLALMRHTAIEWGPLGVRANAVSPGFIRTALSEYQYAHGDLLALRQGMVPLRRIGLPEEVADAVGFLASDGAAFVSGQELVVDGGFLQTPLIRAQPAQFQYGDR